MQDSMQILTLFAVYLPFFQKMEASGEQLIGKLCNSPEYFSQCGCEPTCDQSAPVCLNKCTAGCFCPQGLVRNPSTNLCSLLKDCPPPMTKIDRLEIKGLCRNNQVYKLCGCEKSCNDLVPNCLGPCVSGCFCKEGYALGSEGNCIPIETCPQVPWTGMGRLEIKSLCGNNQAYHLCGCEKTCHNLTPSCSGPCVNGCFCNKGYVMGPSGSCIAKEFCPEISAVSLIGAHELTVEDCGPDEEFLSCGWCEPTCSSLHPQCPAGVCTTGCLCRPPLVRHYSGRCVEPEQCLPLRCPQPNEVYRCLYGCEKRCPDISVSCTYNRDCTLGCHCKQGFVRNFDGLCIRPDKCLIY